MTRPHGDFEAVREPRPPCGQLEAGELQCSPRGFVAERAEDDDHAQPREEFELAHEIRAALVALGRRRLVRRRRATHRRGDVHVGESQTVVAPIGRRLVREPGAMERREQEVAGAIAGEDAPGAVPAVRGRSEPDDQHAGIRVAEPGDGPAPVVVGPKGRSLLARDRFPPGDEPRTGPALDDLGGECAEIGRARPFRPVASGFATLAHRHHPIVRVPSVVRCGSSCW